MILARAFLGLGFAGALFSVPAAAQTPLITEFMASNNTTLADQDGDFADWVEVYNPGPAAANLGGWYLTDKASKPTKWRFPSVTLPAGGYLVVFCSQKNYTDPAEPLATSFNLSASSGYIGLVMADGKTVASSYTYGTQYPDISYGVSQPTDGSTPQAGYFAAATPGSANGGQSNILLSDMVSSSPAPRFFTQNLSLSLSGATGTELIRYQLSPGSSAGDQVPLPTGGSPGYLGTLSLGTSELVEAAAFAGDDSQRGMVLPSMYIQLDSTTSNRVDTFQSSLPLLVFDDNGYGLLPDDDLQHPGWIAAFSPQNGVSTLTQTPDFFTPDTMKLHGYSSASFLKQSYDIDLEDQQGNDLDEAFFGLDSSKDWDSIGAWYFDRTFIHNAVVYSIANSMGHWAPSTRFAEMFIHSGGGALDYTSYSGVTSITDRIKVDAGRVNIFSIDPSDVTAPDVTGGYILRIDHPESDLYSWMTNAGQTVMIDNPKLDVLVQPQIDYITGYVQQMESAMYSDQASGWATRSYLLYLDRPSWVDFHMLNLFTENVDAFIFSEYFSKDVGGPIVAGPVWDFDRSMGSADGRDVNPQTWSANSGYSFWSIDWWGVLATDPDFMQAWIDRWGALRGSVFSDGRLGSLVSSLASQVGAAAAARDIARWPDDAGRFGDGSWQGEIDNLSSWMTTRADWIDQQFEAAPSVQLSAQSRTLTPQPSTSIAYTLDGTDPRLSGGALSPSAVVTASPVTLPSGQAFTARTYDARMAGSPPPGSPWSAPIGADRLINVSGRGAVSAGANALIEGFVVTGPALSAEQVLIRAVGPGLSAFSVASPLSAPVLTLYDSGGNVLATNAGWSSGGTAGATETLTAELGAFALAPGSADSALVTSLPPGSYTVEVTGAQGAVGTALGEIYESGYGGAALVDLSTRGAVPAGGNLINGFAVTGSGPAQILVRAVGPALAAFGVSGPLAQPVLQVVDASGNVVATNTGWSKGPNPTAVAAAAATAGAFALSQGSADSALLLTLQPGNYTAIVSGAAGSSGVALAETYVVP